MDTRNFLLLQFALSVLIAVLAILLAVAAFIHHSVYYYKAGVFIFISLSIVAIKYSYDELKK